MAISFDNSVAGTHFVTSTSSSYTNNGSVLVVGMAGIDSSFGTITYGGITVPKVKQYSLVNGGISILAVYILYSPPTGANTLAASGFGTGSYVYVVSSYNGALYTDATTTGDGTSNQTPVTANLPVVASNCWGYVVSSIQVATSGTGTNPAATGYTARQSEINYNTSGVRFRITVSDSNGTISSGSNTISVPYTVVASPTYGGFIAISLSPTLPSVKNGNFLNFI